MDIKNFFKRIYLRISLRNPKKQIRLKQAVEYNDLQAVYNLVKAGANVNYPYQYDPGYFDERPMSQPLSETVSVRFFARTNEMKKLLKFLGSKTSEEIREEIRTKEEKEHRKKQLRKKEENEALLKKLFA